MARWVWGYLFGFVVLVGAAAGTGALIGKAIVRLVRFLV